MNARPSHKRSQSNGLKPQAAHARSGRPALSSRRSPSYNNAAANNPSTALRRQKSRGEVVNTSDADGEDMAASFLQFWYVPVDHLSSCPRDPCADQLSTLQRDLREADRYS